MDLFCREIGVISPSGVVRPHHSFCQVVPVSQAGAGVWAGRAEGAGEVQGEELRAA